MSNVNIVKLDRLMDTIHYMDPDGTRFVDWLQLDRCKDGLHDTYSDRVDIDNGKVEATHEFILSLRVSKDELLKQMTAQGYENILITEYNTSIMNRRIVLSDGKLVLLATAGADDHCIVATAIGDEWLVKLHVEPIGNHYKVLRHLEYESLIGFDNHGPITRTTMLNERETLYKNANDEFYPFIKGGIEKLVEDFSASSANVLLVYGPPGTGKSTLLRTIIRMMARKTNSLIDDSKVIDDPRFSTFIRTVPSDSTVTIEDADNLCSKREDGNMSMSSLLNMTDGILTSSTKFLISTNLSSLNTVDEALYRKGRTFAVISFRELTPSEANLARQSIGLKPISITDKSCTLSEALNWEIDNGNEITRVGF